MRCVTFCRCVAFCRR